ncbi:PIN domain-containing protein [Patescibacteria group bacterium]|nr:PIN domain-containing protein [Patescibacteria group bacterium]
MSKFLIDSDVIIWALRGKKETIDLLRKIQQLGVPACSPISIVEVQLGVREGEEEETLEFLNSLNVYNIDKNVANQTGEFIKNYKKKGITLSVPDALIATTCILNDLTLVAYNKKHYPLKELKIYSL